MNIPTFRKCGFHHWVWLAGVAVSTLILAESAHGAAPGVKGATGNPVFNLSAEANYISQPDGQAIYSWGYGCAAGSTPTFAPTMSNNNCPTMQIPGPTLIVNEGDVVTVTLTNNLPVAGAIHRSCFLVSR